MQADTGLSLVEHPEENISLIVKAPRSEIIVRVLMMLAATFSILVASGIVVVLVSQSSLILNEEGFSVWGFISGKVWQPQTHQFGFLPLLSATIVTSAIAMLVSIPLGLASAIYLSEVAPKKLRAVLKALLEGLAAVPTVVYGFFALQTVSPFIRGVFGEDVVQFQNMLSAGLVMGFMILPLVASLSEDALRAVPYSIREASYGLGATRFETALHSVVPAGLSGIVAAIILGFSRAVGETMIVALAAGSGPNFTFNPFLAAETITGHIVRISGGELSYGSVEYRSLFLLGLGLFVITLVLNLLSDVFVRRYRGKYQ